MPVNINGYALSNPDNLTFGASGTKVIALNYGIKQPTLPGMNGAATLGGTVYKKYPFPVNSVDLNIGSPWNTSTYLFTAPVAGIYYTSYSGIVGDGVAQQTAPYIAVIVSGVNYYWGYKDTISVWELMHIEILFKMAAGDTLGWAMNIAPGPASSYTGGGYQSNHNTVTVWLVG
jgi:hypothetical protein